MLDTFNQLVACRLAKFLGILTLESFTSSSIGLAVGSVAPSPDAAQAIGPAVMVVFIVFGGQAFPRINLSHHYNDHKVTNCDDHFISSTSI